MVKEALEMEEADAALSAFAEAKEDKTFRKATALKR